MWGISEEGLWWEKDVYETFSERFMGFVARGSQTGVIVQVLFARTLEMETSTKSEWGKPKPNPEDTHMKTGTVKYSPQCPSIALGPLFIPNSLVTSIPQSFLACTQERRMFLFKLNFVKHKYLTKLNKNLNKQEWVSHFHSSEVSTCSKDEGSIKHWSK